MTSAMESFEPPGEGFLFDDRLFAGFFVVVAVLAVAIVGLVVWAMVRNLRAVRSGQGGRLRAPLADRLQELDDLHRRGLISDAEHAMARQRALTSP